MQLFEENIKLRSNMVAAGAAALQQVIQNDPVNSRLEAVLAPALAPVLQYMARTPAFSDVITAVAAVNSTLVALHLCCAGRMA